MYRNSGTSRLMIVCSCNRISEREIRESARKGLATPEAAYASLGHEPQCGCCLDYAQILIDDEQRICRARKPARPHLRAVA